jgi:phosphoesterase RecJ-like protein
MNYKEINTEFTKNFFDIVSDSKEVLLTTHISPDSDAISSILTLYQVLIKKFPNYSFRMAITGEIPKQYSCFNFFEKIEFVVDVAEVIGSTDLLIVLDGSQYFRFSRQPEILSKISKKICIDHHASEPDIFTLSIIVKEEPCTSIVIYKTFDLEKELSKEIAETVFLGVLGDTGNFTYLNPKQSDVLAISAKLINYIGVSIEKFQSRYQTISKREFALFQEFIKNTSYIYIQGWPSAQYSFINRDILLADSYSDIEVTNAKDIYLAHFLRKISDYGFGFVAVPRTYGDVHFSFRSIEGNVNVRDMVERMGIGGGHDRASGAGFKKEDKDLDVLESIKKITDWMKDNEPVLK